MPSDPADRPPRATLLDRFTGRQWVAFDVVAAGAVFASAVFYIPRPGSPGGPIAFGVLLALLATAPILIRRRRPVPVLVVVTIAVAALTLLGRSLLLPTVTLSMASYTVASRVPRRSSLRALACAEIILAAALAVGLAWPVRSFQGLDAENMLVLAAAWVAGDALSKRQRIIEAEQARRATGEERVRIARELHDVVAHSLAVITVQAGLGRRLMAKHPEQAGAALESIEAIGRTAQDELRAVLGLLRDEGAGPPGLAPAPRLGDVPELAETIEAAGIPVSLRTSGIDQRLSPALELSVYRVVQEALTNVVKHAPGARATVDIVISAAAVSIEVTDDGGAHAAGPPGRAIAAPGPGPRTPAPPARPPGSRHGIAGMRERVSAFGGSLTAETVPGRGFRVAARIPLRESP